MLSYGVLPDSLLLGVVNESNQKNKYISLGASETAVLQGPNTLLSRDKIYEPLAELIREARDRANEAKSKSPNGNRASWMPFTLSFISTAS